MNIRNFFNKKNIIILVAIALVIVISTTLILVFFLTEDDDSNIIKPEDNQPIVYSLDVRSAFSRDLGIWVTQFLPVQSVNSISNELLNVFSKARISSDKVSALGSHLRVSKINLAELLKGLYYTDAEGNLQWVDNLEPKIVAIVLGNVLNGAESGFRAVNWTEEDIGNIIYIALTENADTAYLKLVDKVGKKEFKFIVVNTITVYLALKNTFGGVPPEDSGARLLHSAIFELGSQYKRLVSKLTESELKQLLGLNFRYDTSDMTGEDKVVNDAVNMLMDKVDLLFYFGINSIISTMLDTNVSVYENYFRYKREAHINVASADIYLLYSGLHFTRSLNRSMIANFNQSIANFDDLKARIIDALFETSVLKYNLEVRENTGTKAVPPLDYDQTLTHITSQITAYFDNIIYVNNNFNNINTLDDVRSLLTAEQTLDLKRRLLAITEVDEEISKTLTYLASFASMTMLGAIADAYKNIGGNI